MIQQTLFPFKLEMTKDKLTSKAGLSIFAEYNHYMGLTELADKYLTRPKSNRGFNPSVFINSLVFLYAYAWVFIRKRHLPAQRV